MPRPAAVTKATCPSRFIAYSTLLYDLIVRPYDNGLARINLHRRIAGRPLTQSRYLKVESRKTNLRRHLACGSDSRRQYELKGRAGVRKYRSPIERFDAVASVCSAILIVGQVGQAGLINEVRRWCKAHR
jgi:hypothetical protein